MNSNFKTNVKQVLIAVALSAATTSAFAVGANYDYPGDLNVQAAKTRAEVKAEFAQARTQERSEARPNQYRDAASYTDNRTRAETSALSVQSRKHYSDPSSLYFGG
jgi:hypothetical protein